MARSPRDGFLWLRVRSPAGGEGSNCLTPRPGPLPGHALFKPEYLLAQLRLFLPTEGDLSGGVRRALSDRDLHVSQALLL